MDDAKETGEKRPEKKQQNFLDGSRLKQSACNGEQRAGGKTIALNWLAREIQSGVQTGIDILLSQSPCWNGFCVEPVRDRESAQASDPSLSRACWRGGVCRCCR
jgi:hypothetical protein